MSSYVLRTQNISKKYGNTYAVANVNIEIKQGQVYGLIGLNGAGKSTFMRVVTGLITPTDGIVELFGQTGESALQNCRQQISQSIETPAIYPDMTAEQNLEIQRIVGGIADKTIVKKTLNLVGLFDAGNKKTKNFSLGMKQRLALAIALITNPEFLILDEPANGLDPKGIIEIRELIRRLAVENGLTLLVSSHLLDELAQVATHYGILHKGKLVKQLSAEELIRESRQYVKIIVDDINKATTLLKDNFGVTDCQVIAANEIRVYEKINKSGAINAMLVHQGITVESIGVTGQRLEDYFMNLTERTNL